MPSLPLLLPENTLAFLFQSCFLLSLKVALFEHYSDWLFVYFEHALVNLFDEWLALIAFPACLLVWLSVRDSGWPISLLYQDT